MNARQIHINTYLSLKGQTPHDVNRESGVVEPLVDGGRFSARQSWVEISHQDNLKLFSQYFFPDNWIGSSHRPDRLEVEGTARASRSCRPVSSPDAPGRCRGRRQGLSQGRSADPWWRHQGSCGPHRGGGSSLGSEGGEQPSLPAMSQGGRLAKMSISDHSSKYWKTKNCQSQTQELWRHTTNPPQPPVCSAVVAVHKRRRRPPFDQLKTEFLESNIRCENSTSPPQCLFATLILLTLFFLLKNDFSI